MWVAVVPLVMLLRARVLLGLGVLSALVVGCRSSEEETAASDNAIAETDCSHSNSCVVAQAALTGSIREKLATELDSGWLAKGPIKVRTKFTMEPMKGEPLFTVEMPKGAILEASWSPSLKNTLTIKTRTEQAAAGNMKVRYTLIPTLAAEIYGVSINYDSTQLLEKLTQRDLNYDAKSEAPLVPWGFEGAQTTVPAPRLEDTTLFRLAFDTIGINDDVAEGQLAIQAVARPTFTYKTKTIQLDSESIKTADGSTKVPIGDYDSVDVIARLEGELEMAGELDVRPVVKLDSVAGVPTLGLINYSFSAASKPFEGKSTVRFDPTTIHIALPNVKVPTTPFSLGDATGDSKLTKTVTIQNTGELAAVIKVESTDAKFTVPTGEIKIEPKGKYDLEIAFQPEGSGSSSSTITVKSNDPDSPEQTFLVSANGPPEPEPAEEPEEEDEPKKEPTPPKRKASDDGCAVVATGANVGSATPWALAFGLGLLLKRRRRA